LTSSVLPTVRFTVSETANAFCRVKLNNEFYFATAGQIYRILASPQAKKKLLTFLDRLNAAHFDFNIDWLWWLAQPAKPH
jgi:hypothetical protein